MADFFQFIKQLILSTRDNCLNSNKQQNQDHHGFKQIDNPFDEDEFEEKDDVGFVEWPKQNQTQSQQNTANNNIEVSNNNIESPKNIQNSNFNKETPKPKQNTLIGKIDEDNLPKQQPSKVEEDDDELSNMFKEMNTKSNVQSNAFKKVVVGNKALKSNTQQNNTQIKQTEDSSNRFGMETGNDNTSGGNWINEEEIEL